MKSLKALKSYELFERCDNLAKRKYNTYMKEDNSYCHEQSFLWGYQEGYYKALSDFKLDWKDIAIILTCYTNELEAGNISKYGSIEDMKKQSIKILKLYKDAIKLCK